MGGRRALATTLLALPWMSCTSQFCVNPMQQPTSLF